VLLGVWQLVGHSFGVLFVPFSTTMRELWDMTFHGPIPSGLLVSGKLFLASLGISIGVGLVVGLALARSRVLASAFESYIYLVYATPTITLVPFMFAAFGFGFWPQVVIAVLICVFPVLIGVAEGARSIPRELLDVAASYGSNEAQLWRHVIVPYVVPHAMTGIKQTISLALVGTLVAQFFLNATGIADILIQASTALNPGKVLAVTLLISIIAIVLVGVGEAIQRYFTRWQ
jgi:NitT/TauT family transport system permease protein